MYLVNVKALLLKISRNKISRILNNINIKIKGEGCNFHFSYLIRLVNCCHFSYGSLKFILHVLFPASRNPLLLISHDQISLIKYLIDPLPLTLKLRIDIPFIPIIYCRKSCLTILINYEPRRVGTRFVCVLCWSSCVYKVER